MIDDRQKFVKCSKTQIPKILNFFQKSVSDSSPNNRSPLREINQLDASPSLKKPTASVTQLPTSPAKMGIKTLKSPGPKTPMTIFSNEWSETVGGSSHSKKIQPEVLKTIEEFVCGTCDEIFSDESSLKRHESTHSKVKFQ